ncbi:UNVERIFIED_CONTAM: hypothetical protein FKN15_050138 [Acipenser sinensis]
MFCGGSDGNIFQVALCGTNLQRDKSFQTDREGNQVFKGHRNLVTCLSVSMDGTLLVSGSHDETVRLWDIQSKQCVRTVNHKGSVTNAFIMPAPANMFQPDSRPTVGLPRFTRHLNTSEPGEGGEMGGVSLRLGLHMQVQDHTHTHRHTWRPGGVCSSPRLQVLNELIESASSGLLVCRVRSANSIHASGPHM